MSSSLDGWEVAVIVIGVLFGLSCIAAVLFWWSKRSSRRMLDQPMDAYNSKF